MDREKLRIWAQEWAHNNDIPEAVMDLFLDAAEIAVKVQPGVTGERLGDHSISYAGAAGILGRNAMSPLDAAAYLYLKPYRRLKFQ